MGRSFNLLFPTVLSFLAYLLTICHSKPPVILVPGDAGSRLQARLQKNNSPHFWCEKTSDWFQIWLSVEELLPEVIDCWSDNMKLVYNKTTRRLNNPDGVEIRVPYFGGTEGIEYLDSTIDHPGEYFAPLVESLVKIGYVRGKTLFGAPYDFRFAPNTNDDYLNKLEKLIEDASASNNGSQVILISHSLGCPYTKYFLDNHDQKWKEKFIHSWITVADKAPNVTLYCFYGTKVPTPESFTFGEGEFPDTFPKYNLGDGDGTVNIRSLRGCKEYIGKQVPPISVKEYPGAEHLDIIGDKRVVDDITKILDGLE
ncbi:Group XV phospholipase A2 [Exaiptasia diaphana]|nr:Group XV phospholipase A2 [Exaiptasia diaphana]